MGVQNWIRKQPARMREEGVYNAASKNFKEVSRYTLQKVEPLDPRGANIYEKDWDVLIILDACRVDVLQEVAPEYDFLSENIETFRSLGSASRIWMERNFTKEFQEGMQATAHITSNPYSESYLHEADFFLLDEVWRYGWDESKGTVPARNITDRAISTARQYNPDCLLVHYMQPHFPSIPEPLGSEINIDTFGNDWNSVWDQLANKEIEKETVWSSYRENLRYVLADVEILLNNIDAEKVAISADHGNAFGEWGYYGHPPHIPIKVLRNVPWITTTAADKHTYEPQLEKSTDKLDQENVKSRLEDLGYM